MSKPRRRKNQNKNPNGDKHPIDEMLKFQNRWVREFSTAYPSIWEIIGSGISIVKMTQWMIAHLPNPPLTDVHRLAMWQTVLDYQMQSVVLILQHRLDSGLALLRMATELSRDVHVIGRDDARMDLWVEKEKRKREYQNVFKFDTSLPPGQMVYNVYKLCSAFGVHGHITNNMFSEPIGRGGNDGQLTFTDVSEIGILDSVETWLMGFVPIHHLCSNEFFASRPAELFQQFSLWREFEVSLSDIAQSFHVSLIKLKEESGIHQGTLK